MVTLGSDTEVFVKRRDSGSVVPIIGMVGGTKECPLPMPGMSSGYAVQEDNVMLEFNIPACDTADDAVVSIHRAMRMLPQLIPDDVELDYQCSRVFSPEMLSHPQAQTMGCLPDLDAYKQGPARPVRPAELLRPDGYGWRFCGGHVHVGYRSDVPHYVVAQLMDLFVGLPSLAVDKQGERRKRYGTAGRYRIKPYGIEYRSLSNFWVFDEYMTSTVMHGAYSVGQLVEQNPTMVARVYAEIPWLEVRRAINREDEARAADILQYANTELGLEIAR